ncbi:MAG: rhomboid family intramembrane serine protease [Patescibacteria group bacterium]|nr:rhomboid family intramembrane serine protease [Patescibacteria group bacterium]
MGLYDRDYYRGDSKPGFSLRAPRTAIGWIILINVGLWLMDAFLPQLHLMRRLELRSDSLFKPWLWWEMISYGFAHAETPSHVLFNMLGLFFLGRDVEWTYGKREFIRLYLALLLAGGLTWSIVLTITGQVGAVLGASGAVAGIVVLYALHFPRRTLLLFFVIPMPAWVLGVFLVVSDILGAMRQGDQDVAYIVHLAGAAFALLYFKSGMRLERLGLGMGVGAWLRRLRSPRLRVHRPEVDEADSDESLHDEVDRILEKITREGEASLTRRERRVLQDASRRYQERLR